MDFVPVHDSSAFETSDPLLGLREGGALFVQSRAASDTEAWAQIPTDSQMTIRHRKLRVLYLDAVGVARELAATPDLSLRMQGIVLLGVFLRAVPFVREKGLGDDELFTAVGKALEKYFGRRGAKVVEANLAAVRRGYSEVREIDFAHLAHTAVNA